jgi:hypothetical protein
MMFSFAKSIVDSFAQDYQKSLDDEFLARAKPVKLEAFNRYFGESRESPLTSLGYLLLLVCGASLVDISGLIASYVPAPYSTKALQMLGVWGKTLKVLPVEEISVAVLATLGVWLVLVPRVIRIPGYLRALLLGLMVTGVAAAVAATNGKGIKLF